MTFPMVLRSAIGLHPPGVCCCFMVFPGLRNTTTPALRKRLGKYSSAKLALASLVRISASGGPHAFRNPVGRRSSVPGAFQAPACRSISAISVLSTSLLTSNGEPEALVGPRCLRHIPQVSWGAREEAFGQEL